MKKSDLILIVFALFSMQIVLAEISLSEPLEVYNLGDRLHVDVMGIRGSGSGNLDIDLICGNATVNLVRISARAFSTEEDQIYSIPYKILEERDLEISNLSSILGPCQVVSSLGGLSATTKTFTITDSVNVKASLDNLKYNPGEEIMLSVEAIKANGNFLEGFMEVSNATEISKAIVGGVASEVFSTHETIEAGIYTLNIQVYDLGENGVLNKGESKIDFEINQVPSFIKMSLSDEVATPGKSFSIGVEAFDQSGISMPGTISFRLISPEEESIEMTVQGGDFKEVNFPLNASAGTWRILSSFEGLIDERDFEMKEIQMVEFEFGEDSALVIRNVGNSVYNKTITVQIGEERKEIELRIGIGEKREFDLKAPNGEYEVVVEDGENKLSKNMLLTGRAISVDDLTGPGIIGGYSALWIFISLVIGIVVAYFILKYYKSRDRVIRISNGIGKVKDKVDDKIPGKIKSEASESINFTKKSPEVNSLDSKNYDAEDKSMVDMTRKKVGIAESSLVMKGEKYPSVVLALHIRNYSSLNDHSKLQLKKIIENSSDKGLIDWRGEYIFLLFAPLVTKTYGNEILAARASTKILEELNRHNRKFNDKLEFNLGVHSGELVASKEKGKLKYTSIGNTISFSKKLSDSGKGKILISNEVRKKLLRDLKVEKEGDINGKAIYSVTEIKDRQANEAKLKDLLKRM